LCQIALPVTVDESKVRAAFLKKKHRLKLTAPIVPAQ
jgi:hypothetical protein